MNINWKRLFAPLICTAVGLFNFIFMFMNYAALFATGGGESESLGYSAYKCLEFGDESLSKGLELFMSFAGKDAKLTFLLVLVSLLLIGVILLSLALLAIGVVGILKEFTQIDVLDKIDTSLVKNLSKLLLKVHFWVTVAASALLLLTCLINLYIGKVFGETIFLGLRPGAGFFFLLILAVGAWIAHSMFEKAFANVPDVEKVVYKCPSCGAKAKESDKFCAVCGAAIQADPAKDDSSSEA